MTMFTTSIAEDSQDQASFTNPFTNTTYMRGRLQVSVNADELIGEEAHRVVERQQAHTPETTHQPFPAIIDPTHIAIGPFISGLNDNLFFDAVLGVGTSGVFGYNNPAIFSKLQRLGSVLPGFMGAGTDFYYVSRHGAPTAQDLAELMCSYTKEAFGEEFVMNFANAGTEANENALKVAMYSKFRQISKLLGNDLYAEMCEQLGIKKVTLDSDSFWSNYPFFILAFKHAFHGRTATSNTLSMSKRKHKEGYQTLSYVVHVPYNGTADFDGIVDATPLAELIRDKQLKAVIDSGKIPVDLLSAIIMEPVQGEGGYIVPEPELLRKLNDFLAKYRQRGVFLLSDEVQCGLFRTGKFTGMQNWTSEYPQMKPDLMTFAKPLHVGGVLIRKSHMQDWPGGKFSGTWAEGNLLMIAMAVYTLEELKRVDPSLGRSYPENAVESGKYLRSQLASLGDRLDERFPGANLVRNVRGLGQMNAFDVPDAELIDDIIYQSFLHGVHILSTGQQSIRIFGAVDQRKREADMLVHILEDVLVKVVDKHGAHGRATVQREGNQPKETHSHITKELRKTCP